MSELTQPVQPSQPTRPEKALKFIADFTPLEEILFIDGLVDKKYVFHQEWLKQKLFVLEQEANKPKEENGTV